MHLISLDSSFNDFSYPICWHPISLIDAIDDLNELTLFLGFFIWMFLTSTHENACFFYLIEERSFYTDDTTLSTLLGDDSSD
jgi:hypothetical protein